MDFSTWLQNAGYDVTALNADDPVSRMQRRHLESAWKADANTPAPRLSELTSILQPEHDRQHAILSAVASSCKTFAGHEKKLAKFEAIGQQAVAEGWEPNRAALALIREERDLGGPVFTSHAPRGAAEGAVLEASLLCTMGHSESDVGRLFSESVANAAFSKPNRGASLHALMRATLQAAGKPVFLGKPTTDDIRRVFKADEELRAEGPSTLAVSGILSNAQNKALLISYQGVGTTWAKFCRTRPLNDFKASSSYRLNGQGALTKVPGGGELKNISLSNDTQTVQADQYGALLGIDRKDIVNDDLGAFSQGGKILGRMGAVGIEQAVYTLLLSNPSSFFGTGHKNSSTGGGSALSLTGLGTAHALFNQQLDDNGFPVMLKAAVLLVPSALEITARNIISSQFTVIGGSTLTPTANAFSQLYEPVASPWLSTTTGLTGASDAGWYLLTAPNDFAIMQVGFLGGAEVPTVEIAMMDFDRLGISMRCYHDWGVGMGDYRGGVFSVGS